MSKVDVITKWFEDAMRESYEFYVADIRYESASNSDYESRLEEEMAEADCETEEDYIDYLCNDWDDAMEWYEMNFGVEDLGHAVLVALGLKTWGDFR